VVPLAAPGTELIKGYRILERLGRGGMGSVYRALQVEMNRVVALKILRLPLAGIEQHVERLKREARLVGGFDHPNIVRGLEAGQSGPYHYFTMEFVEGESLRDRLQRGPAPEAEALRIVEQVLEALDHAHSRGVVHRDVKPGNVILTPDGLAKVTDFGLAKGPADFTLTQSGVTIGTPQYISPEQAREPSGVDGQTDLYSLGATLYHMLTGVPPHTSETLAGLLTKVLYEKPRTARQVYPRVSEGASFFAEKLMAKQKRHRYGAPRDALRDLRRLKAGHSIVPRDWAGDFEVQEVRRRYRRVTVAAVVLAAAATAGTIYFRDRAERARLDAMELAADNELAALQKEHAPGRRTEEGLRAEVDALKALTKGRFRGSRAAGEAGALLERRLEELSWWDRVRQLRGFTARTVQGRLFREALARIRSEEEEFAGAGDPARNALIAVEALREEVRGNAVLEGRAQVAAARRDLEQAHAGPGAAALAETRLRELRAHLLANVVEEEGSLPVRELDQVLDPLSEARALVEQYYLQAYRDLREGGAVREGRFLELRDALAVAAARIEDDPRLQDAFARLLPAPAVADLRGTAELPGALDREQRKVEEENRQANEAALAKAAAQAEAGDLDSAVETLQDAEAASIESLREPLAEVRTRYEARRREEQQRAERRRDEVLGEFFADLLRRDLEGALARLDAVLAKERPGSLVGETATSGHLLCVLLRDLVFEAARRGVEAAPDGRASLGFPGDPSRFERLRGVRTETAPGGEVFLVFEAPGAGVQRRPLRLLALQDLLALAGLEGDPPDPRQRLCRAALLIVEGETRTDAELGGAEALLHRVGGKVAGAGPMVEALLARSASIMGRRLAAQNDRNSQASGMHKTAQRRLADGDPARALADLESLLKPLFSGTAYVKEHQADIRSDLDRANRMLGQQDLRILYPSARILAISGRGGTILEWDFEEESGAGPMRDFLPPPEEGGCDALYRRADVAAIGAEPNGVLQFLAPERGSERRLRDSPLTILCPFTPSRRIVVSFKVSFARPYYFQVSICGTHVGIATDDGRRESGRGVFAWQSQDWRSPDDQFPDLYRHEYVSKHPELLKGPAPPGKNRYFQFDEAGRPYFVQVFWENHHAVLYVDGQKVWDQVLVVKNYRDSPPRIRLLSYTPCEIDGLLIEGEEAPDQIRDFLRRRKR